MSRRAYYAHCIAIYNTPQEERDVALLESAGFDVTNPNDPDIQARCTRVKQVHGALLRTKTGTDALSSLNPRPLLSEIDAVNQDFRDAGEAVMELVFKPLVSAAKCDAVFFRALPDGRIPAGVAQEIEWAHTNGVPVFELPSGLIDRVMSVDSTRNYLREIGER